MLQQLNEFSDVRRERGGVLLYEHLKSRLAHAGVLMLEKLD